MALHLDPPQAHTVNIEPVTATDWESECDPGHLNVDIMGINV